MPAVRVQRRGKPDDPQEEVAPGAVGCLPPPATPSAGAYGERQAALAGWPTDRRNPLTRRVAVNRIWHHHFGTGIVDTPSDFGLGGGRPSHPELLDYLAGEFAARGWSAKWLHRLVCTSASYRQASAPTPAGLAADAGTRLLWRVPPRRLEAEAARDAVLAVSGKLNREPCVYRFAVRTTAHQFLTTLDCPNPANLTPARTATATPLQALALLNNEFVLRQSRHFADRRAAEAGSAAGQVDRAFRLAFGRPPTAAEAAAAVKLVRAHGLPPLCRVLFDATEFVYVD